MAATAACKLLVSGVVTSLQSHSGGKKVGAVCTKAIKAATAKQLKVKPQQIKSVHVVRKTIDARRYQGADIRLVFNVQAELGSPKLAAQAVARGKNAKLIALASDEESYQPRLLPPDSPAVLAIAERGRPVVVGSGPAGLFAAYTLARSGLRPIVIEKGPRVERRASDLMAFWKQDNDQPPVSNSNGVFGEGGAGAFSDGKLTTRTRTPYNRFVHDTLIEHGAKANITFESRAHVGTDQLRKIITSFARKGIEDHGGTMLFNTQLVGLDLVPETPSGGQEKGSWQKVKAVRLRRMPLQTDEERKDFEKAFHDISDCVQASPSPALMSAPGAEAEQDDFQLTLKTDAVMLASGHSARDVYWHCAEAGVAMQRMDFAIGLRLQISQKYIDDLTFGKDARHPLLGPAEFSLKMQDRDTKRSVYTFCMCPGGVIVNASHGNGEVAVNGMSYSTRASRFANAAFVVVVGGDDFDNYDPPLEDAPRLAALERTGADTAALTGLFFQQHWERKCFELAGSDYAAPAQRVPDFLAGRKSENLPDSLFMGRLQSADLNEALPDYVTSALARVLKRHAERSMPGLIAEDTLLVGAETRTSAPIRILRDESTLESTNVKHLYPIGEGAGYSGGIMTSSIDGVRAAEAYIKRHENANQRH